jgi:hypothetical protein
MTDAKSPLLESLEAWCEDADQPPPHHVVRQWRDDVAASLARVGALEKVRAAALSHVRAIGEAESRLTLGMLERAIVASIPVGQLSAVLAAGEVKP